MMHDEILEQEAREQFEAQGMDEMTIEIVIGEMAESGMFDVPDADE